MAIKKALVLSFIIFFQGCLAMASSEDSHGKYFDGGFVYEFKEIPKHGGSGEFLYNIGRISVFDKDGKLVSMSLYNQSPGCGDDFSTIRSLKIPLSPLFSSKNKKQNFIIFCGSNGGRHKTLRLYNSKFGFVSAIDFFDGPINLIESEKELHLVINHKKYFKSVRRLISFPVVYKLTSNLVSVSLSVSNSKRSNEIYKIILVNDSGKPTDNISDLFRALIASMFSDDKESYCRASTEIAKNRFQSIQEDLENTLGRKFTFNCSGK